MENVNINDDSVKSLKAILCDVFTERIKDLTSIQESEVRDKYIKLLGEITKEVEKLTEMIDELDNLEVGIKENGIGSSTSDEVVTDRQSDVISSEDNETGIQKEIVTEENPVESSTSENNNTEDSQEKVSPVIDINPIKMNTEIVPKIPNIFGGCFNNLNIAPKIENVSAEQSTPSEESISLPENTEQEISVNNDVVVPSVTNEKNLLQTSAVSEQEDIPLETSVIPFPNVETVVTPVSSNKMVLIKQKDDKTKAILVNRGQFEKLSNSKNTQESLLDFGNISESKENLESKIEEMMTKASSLYKEGKKDEAQDIYNQISLMNKGNTLVKEIA